MQSDDVGQVYDKKYSYTCVHECKPNAKWPNQGESRNNCGKVECNVQIWLSIHSMNGFSEQPNV